jgi:hypothetical protein
MHDPDICRHLNTHREWVIQFEFIGVGESEEAALDDIERMIVLLRTCGIRETSQPSIARLLKENQIVTDGGTQSYLCCRDCGKMWTKEISITKEDVTANTQAHQPD